MNLLLDQNNCLLLIIDIQDKLLKAQPKSEKILQKIKNLASAAKILKIPVIATEQYPQGLGETNTSLKETLEEETVYFEKTAFSCYHEEGFKDLLEEYNKQQIIICGVETHVCVHQTVHDLLKAGHSVYVVQDACGSRNNDEHELGLSKMAVNGANLTSVEISLFELLKTSKHPHFKEIQALIK